jgi:hypothetical protein
MTIHRIISVFAAFSLCSASGEVENIPEIGVHQPIVTVRKSVNPQNLLIVYTKEDANGRFIAAEGKRPVFDFYWLMGGKNYKPVHGLIKKEIRKRFECQPSPANRATHFIISVNDLKEVNCDIEEPKIDVYASGAGGTSEVEALMSLGPSDENMRIKLSSIYTEGRSFPPAVYAVTLEGEEIVDGKRTGKKVKRRYDAKK